MKLTREEMRRVAEAATQEEWAYGLASLGDKVAAMDEGGWWTIIAESPCRRSPYKSARAVQWRKDATHIATFSPPTVLALLDRLDALEGEPSAAMLTAGWARANEIGPNALGVITDSLCADIYRAMVRAALNPKDNSHG